MDTAESDEAFLAKWGKCNRFTAKTLDILAEEDILSKDVLLTLSYDDIKSLGLSLDHRNMVTTGIQKLKGKPLVSNPSSEPVIEPVTTRTLASNESLYAALEALKNSHLSDLPDLDASDTDTRHPPKSSKGKALKIIDFVTYPECVDKSSECELIKGMVIRASGKRKLATE